MNTNLLSPSKPGLQKTEANSWRWPKSLETIDIMLCFRSQSSKSILLLALFLFTASAFGSCLLFHSQRLLGIVTNFNISFSSFLGLFVLFFFLNKGYWLFYVFDFIFHSCFECLRRFWGERKQWGVGMEYKEVSCGQYRGEFFFDIGWTEDLQERPSW